ncbi:trypsin-like peptidase domain-containing protein [Kovacikia minuta CCNUW1]|uniref:trypsin-like peptidase domain-containing protein n=1 Tax=Kovacikia minuta TaxID=2931930 RepID=UPI001CCF4658|nr:trypsin-like peptidase domain-containing protein [Kovacikia minuta]UBF27960.1 trypsin-like peptidase domain-containing protein [Kovacikia minuta CCNUW1]
MLGSLVAVLVTPTLLPAQLPPSASFQANLKQQISTDSKPALVRIVAGCSGTYSYSRNEFSTNEVSVATGEIGSGFFVDPNGYIVTNSHVVSPSTESGCRELLFRRLVQVVTGRDDVSKVSEDTKRDLRNRSQIKGEIDYVNRVVLPTGASLPFETRRSGAFEGGKSDDVAVIKINVSNAPTLKLGASSKVESQTPVLALGYVIDQSFKSLSTSTPSEDLSSPSYLQELATGKSLGGVTSLDGYALKPDPKSGNNLLVLQFNNPLPLGISGSPVLNDKGEVIGIITTGEKAFQEESTSAFVIPTQTVLEFVEQAGGKNQPSQTNRLYREGYDLFLKGNFEGALKKLNEVQKLFPYHAEAKNLMGDTEQKIAEEKQKRNGLLWLLGAGAAAGVVAGIYVLSRAGRRRKQSFRPLFKEKPVPQKLAPDSAKSLSGTDRTPIAQPETRRPAAVTQIGGGGAFSPPTVIGTQPFIDLRNQDGQVRRFYLRRQRHQLGRDRDWADLYIPDSGWEVTSRHHATLEREGSDYRIYDGDRQNPSTNGIFVNGTPISTQEGYLLQDGDQIITGDDPRNQMILTYSNPGGNRLTPSGSQTDVTG